MVFIPPNHYSQKILKFLHRIKRTNNFIFKTLSVGTANEYIEIICYYLGGAYIT